MRQTSYRGLAEFGLPLVTPNDPEFASLVRDIESRPQLFDLPPVGDTDAAAVLLNQSGKAVIALAHVCRYTSVEGVTRTSRCSNLCSGMQLDMLTGQAKARQDIHSSILPGSKRLITERGMFGNNLDVLPPESWPRGGGHGGSLSYSGFHGGTSEDQIAGIELCLDFAIFEDGLCAGPDESGLFESTVEALERIRHTAQAAMTALRSGASEGQVFDLVLPLARHTPELAPGGRRHQSHLLGMFANMAIRFLVDRSALDLLDWFEKAAQPPSLRLRRPS
jgi:hypothetical protein